MKDEGPSKEETLIMQSTAIDDLGLIRRTMQNFNYDVDAVYDYLFSIKEMEQNVAAAAEHMSPDDNSHLPETEYKAAEDLSEEPKNTK